MDLVREPIEKRLITLEWSHLPFPNLLPSLQFPLTVSTLSNTNVFTPVFCSGSRWVSQDGVKMKYWGGAVPTDLYKCACGVAQQCAKPSHECNCDKNKKVWREDSGFLRKKFHLPVMELRFGDTEGSIEKGYHTLGKLICYGNIWHGFRSKFEQYLQKLFAKNLLTAR